MLLLLALACTGPDADSADTEDTSETTDTGAGTGADTSADTADTGDTARREFPRGDLDPDPDTGRECGDARIFTFRRDADGDGYGDPDDTLRTCAPPPEGYTYDGMDCDDADPDVNPSAREDCATDVDEDCDGDPSDVDALGCVSWYLDADGDGVGATEAICACLGEEPYTAASTGDCDDGDPTLAETCVLPESDLILTEEPTAPLDLIGDLDGDGAAHLLLGDNVAVELPYGTVTVDEVAVATFGREYDDAGDVTGDGIDDVAWAWIHEEDLDRGRIAFAMSVLNGPHPAGGGAELVVVTETYDYASARDPFSAHAAHVGDVDLDGLDDVVFACVFVDIRCGSWLVPGGLAGEVATDTLVDFHGGGGYAHVDGPGDIDGDGVADVIMGGPDWRAHLGPFVDGRPSDTFYLPGAWHAIGDVDGDGLADAIVDGDEVHLGPAAEDTTAWAWFGLGWTEGTTTAADVDGDGLSEVVYAVREASEDGHRAGLYVFELTPGYHTLEEARRITGEIDGDGFGSGVVALPDRDGDGADDVAVGSDAGVYVFPSL